MRETQKTKKVLVCGIRDFEDRQNSKYYLCRDDGRLRFCDGIVSGEGEAKTILASVDIDEIIAIGTGNQCLTDKSGEQLYNLPKRMQLNQGIDLYVSDTDGFSDFDFFRYRLSQFVEGVNIDTADFIDLVEEDRQTQIIAALHSIFGEDLSLALTTFTCVEGIQDKVLNLTETLTDDESQWMKRYLFSKLDRQHRLTAKSNNSGIPISFVPITDSRNQKVLNRFSNLISELLEDNDSPTELYVDLHGFSLEDSFVCMNALFAISSDPKSMIQVKHVTDVTSILSGYLQEISLASNRYRVQKLLAGIRVFLQHGKTDILREYWAELKQRNPGLKNEYLDQLLLSMSYVDAGISLCSVVELERGICGIRKLLNRPDAQAQVEDEGESLLLALKECILRDYGPLVQGDGEPLDSFELVKWAYGKQFYQQVITIIESRIPSDLVRRGIFYPAATEADKLAYIKAMNFHYWDALAKDRYIFKDLNHYFVKVYGRFAVNYKSRNVSQNEQYTKLRVEQVFGDPTVKNMLPAHSLIQDRDLLEELLAAYYNLSTVRNTINHAQVDQDNRNDIITTESQVWADVGRMIGAFIDCYQRALDAVGTQTPEIVPITPEELRSYTYAHGPKADPEFRNVPGFTSSRGQNKRRGNGKDSHRDHRSGNQNRIDNRQSGEVASPATSPLSAATSERSNINISISLSQRFGDKKNGRESSNSVVIDTGDTQNTEQSGIHIHITLD